MAFSTQKNFLSVAFPIEKENDPPKKRSDAALKTYPSCVDTRAWALNNEKKSQFISEILHRFPRVAEHVSTS